MYASADAGLSGAITGGPLIVAAGVAALVGMLGFLSPCVLPLVPGYLAYVAGLAPDRDDRRRAIVGALLFVLGLTVFFVGEGVLFGQLGTSLRLHSLGISRVLGVVTVVLGLVYMGSFNRLQREFRVPRPPAGLIGAPLLGFTFGIAWTPCNTPTFGAVNALAYSQGTAGRGALLQACYCLGLGVPFIVIACGFGWAVRAVAVARRHIRLINIFGGALLVLMGSLLALGQWNHLMDWLRTSTGPGGFDI